MRTATVVSTMKVSVQLSTGAFEEEVVLGHVKDGT